MFKLKSVFKIVFWRKGRGAGGGGEGQQTLQRAINFKFWSKIQTCKEIFLI